MPYDTNQQFQKFPICNSKILEPILIYRLWLSTDDIENGVCFLRNMSILIHTRYQPTSHGLHFWHRHTVCIVLSKAINKQIDWLKNAWNLELKWVTHRIQTYLIKDPLLFLRLPRTFDGSFLLSWLFLSIIFLFQIVVFFWTDDTKLGHRQPQVLIIYVGGSIHCHMVCICISIILLSPMK